MKQIKIFTAENEEPEFSEYAKSFGKNSSHHKYNFKQFLNLYLTRNLPEDFGDTNVIINEIPNWELIKIYRIILNLEHQNFTLFVHYFQDQLINKYN